jgi:hypothetical protein
MVRKVSDDPILDKRNKLVEPFVKKYGDPVLVHATSSAKLFKNILNSRKIEVPQKDRIGEHSYIEKLFGLYPSIFLSLSFQYNACYDYKFNLIFKLDYLKKLEFYKNSLSFKCYLEIMKYWDKNSPEYISKLSRKNKASRSAVDKFYNVIFNGKTKEFFEYWICEKEVYDLFKRYSKRKEVLKILKKTIEERHKKYPASVKTARKIYLDGCAPEIISKKDIDLMDNKDFLGFYIDGKVSGEIVRILKRDFSDKIFFDGKKIMKVEGMK